MHGDDIKPLGRHVLIIDDNPDLVESLSCLLEHYGCEVEVAYSGQEGLRKAIAGLPDVVFVDIAMPGMTGYDVARAIRAKLPHRMVLIAQTAYGSSDDRDRALECGFDEHIIKPAEPVHLLRRVALARSFRD